MKARNLLLLLSSLALALLLALAATAAGPPPRGTAPQWGGSTEISTEPNSGAFLPEIGVAPGGRLMIAYNSRAPVGRSTPTYSQSTDNGLSWSTPASIHASSTDMLQVALDFDDDGTAHAVWREPNRIVHAREGQWSGNGMNVVANSAQLLLDPDVAATGSGRIHVVWAQGDNLQAIYHAFSPNNGGGWTTPAPLTNMNQKSSVPRVAVDGSGNVHVVWEERVFDIDAPGFFRFEVQYRKGTVSGNTVTWGSIRTLSGAFLNAKRPAIVAAGNVIHVGFARQESEAEQYAYYTRSNNGGASWSAPADTTLGNPLSVNSNLPFFLLATLAACNGELYLYYHGAQAFDDPEQIWGANSKPPAWTPLDQVTSGAARTVNPALACAGGLLHVAYELIIDPGENHQIYHTRGFANVTFLPVVPRQQ